MPRGALIALAMAGLPVAASARSNAAEYLIAQEIARACDGPGSIDPASVIERDLTGDGRLDLVIAHEGISCDATGRSGFCGIRVCAMQVYVRRGPLLELVVDNIDGMLVTVGEGSPPEIRWRGNDGAAHAIRWDGAGFR